MDQERNEELLVRGHAILVQCPAFRCMAYRDREGKWRNYFSDEVLKGDVKELNVG